MIELHHGDCLDIMASLSGVSVIVTDPPYGIGADKGVGGDNKGVVSKYDGNWDRKLSRPFFDAMLRFPNQIIFGGNYYADWLPPSSAWIVWDKMNTGNFSDCELAWTSHSGRIRKISYMWNGMIKQKPEKRWHPTQKPLAVMEWVIENYTQEGDVVLDPFMGSGSTGVACVRTGRSFIGIEIDEHYFKIAQQRIKDAKKQIRLPGL